MSVDPATHAPRSTRQARHLVRRLMRDTGLQWPGGPGNAALKVDRRRRRWRMVTVDRRPAPHIVGHGAVGRMLRDGFVAVHWPEGGTHLYHVETPPDTILRHRPHAPHPRLEVRHEH